MGIRLFIFLSEKLLYFFLGLCDYSVSNLIQVSNKSESSVDKEKLLKEYFHRGYPYATIVSLLEKRHGVRMNMRMLKRKLKKRPRKLRPVRRCFFSTFTLITCRSLIILNFIYARKASQIQVRKL